MSIIILILVGGRLLTLVLVWRAEANYPPVGEMISVGAAQVHLQRTGSGRPVVLLHGNGGQLSDFSPMVIGALKDRYTVIALDRPGHGYSTRPAGTDTLDGQARWLHEVLRKLDIQQPIVVGISWGGALAYATRYPDETAALVLVGGLVYPRLSFSPMYTTYVRMARIPILGDLLVDTLYVPLSYLAPGEAMRAAYAPEAPDMAYVEQFTALVSRPSAIRAATQDEDPEQLLPALQTLSAQYEHLTIPTYILTGDADTNVLPEAHAVPLHEALRNACLVIIPKAGHMLPMTHPGVIAEAIDQVASARLPMTCP